MSGVCPRCGAPAQGAQTYCTRCGLPLAAERAGWSGPLPAGAGVGGRYVVERTLGRGGMGAVYRVRDLRLAGRPCALKEMAVSVSGAGEQEQALRRWHTEAEVLAQLAHAAIPQVYDRLVEGSRYYLVMEYVHGVDLRGLLSDHLALSGAPLPPSAVTALAAQVADVLAYLHARRPPVLHRDVKPANVLVLAGRRVKVVDFGLARPGAAGDATRIGTPGYSPPEQYRGAAEPASDIYALGATVHHLLTGRDPTAEPPFDFPPLASLRPEVGQVTAALVDRMLERVPGRRPTAEEARAGLAAAGARPAAPGEWALLDMLLASRLAEGAGPCPVCGADQRPPGRSYCTVCGMRLAGPHERRRAGAEPADTGIVLPAAYWRDRRPERVDLLGPGPRLRPSVLLGGGEADGALLAFLTFCGERRVLAAAVPPEPDAPWTAPTLPAERLRGAFVGMAPPGWNAP